MRYIRITESGFIGVLGSSNWAACNEFEADNDAEALEMTKKDIENSTTPEFKIKLMGIYKVSGENLIKTR